MKKVLKSLKATREKVKKPGRNIEQSFVRTAVIALVLLSVISASIRDANEVHAAPEQEEDVEISYVLTVSDVNDKAGRFKVTASPDVEVQQPEGDASYVWFEVWTGGKDKENLIVYEPEQNGSSYSITVKSKAHDYATGKYTVAFYRTGADGEKEELAYVTEKVTRTNTHTEEKKDVTYKICGQLEKSVSSKIESAMKTLASAGRDFAFYMYDIESGQQIYYNANSEFYSASSIKGPYVLCLAEDVPDSATNSKNDMTIAITNSDNSAYARLRNKYGNEIFAEWCKEAGVSDTVNTSWKYTSVTASDMKKMWLKGYEFITSSKRNAAFCRKNFYGPLNSMIYKTLGDEYKTYSKAGWIHSSSYYNVYNDCGIVMSDGSPYVLVVLTNPYDTSSDTSDGINDKAVAKLISALDYAHSELCGED